MEAAGYPVVSANAQDFERLLQPKKNGSIAPKPGAFAQMPWKRAKLSSGARSERSALMGCSGLR